MLASATRTRFAGAALLLSVFTDVLTFAYFFPRNAVLLGDGVDVPVLTQAWSEWSRMNHVRSALVAAALVCELTIIRVSATASPQP